MSDPKTSASLDEVLIAFQKTLARVKQKTTSVSKYDSEYIKGNRTLFLIDSIDVELKAGVRIENFQGDDSDKLHLLFDVPEEEKATFKFTVEPSVLTDEQEAMLLLAESPYKPNAYKVTLLDEDPVDKEIVLKCFDGGVNSKEKSFKVSTDQLGEVNFHFDFDGYLHFKGERKPRKTIFGGMNEWFLLATHKRPKVHSNNDEQEMLLSDILKVSSKNA